MTRKLTLLVVALVAMLCSQAQINCSTGRYYDDVFDSVVVTSGITYGENDDVYGQHKILKFDLYVPQGDTATNRPVMILAFGGSFVFGLRTSPDIVQLCNAFTKKGYVCASIDYRLGISSDGFTINAANVKKA